MKLKSAASTIRQLVRYGTSKQPTVLPLSCPVYSLQRNAFEGAQCQFASFHSTSFDYGSRTKMQAFKTNVSQSWMKVSTGRDQTQAGCVSLVRGMAGHSKWANIRHIKAAKDYQKSRVINEYSRKIRAMIRETGQADPKTSSKLARLIAEAKSKNVPNANIDRVLSQMSNLKNSAPVMFTAKGPGGSMMLIEAFAAKMMQTKAELQSIVKKCGFSMFDSGSLAKIAFEEKGVVLVTCPEGATPDLESYVDIAIEAGAEEVTFEEDEEGNKVLQFVCEPLEVYAVKKELEARQLAVSSAEVVYNSTSTVTLDPSILELIAKAMEKLEEHPDVLRVYINVGESS